MFNNSFQSNYHSTNYLYQLTITIIMLVIPATAIAGITSIITYHITMEILVIVISLSILIVTVSTINISKSKWSNYLKYLWLFLGILCIFLLFHIVFFNEEYMKLSYIFDLWESTIRVMTISAFIQLSYRDLDTKAFFRIFVIISMILLGFMVINKIYSQFIIVGRPYNIMGQTFLIILGVINLVILYLKRKVINQSTAIYLIACTTFTILTELMVILNIEYYNLSSIFSHCFKVLSVFIMYRLIVNELLRNPIKYLNQSLLNKNSDLEAMAKQLKLQNENLEKLRKALNEKEENFKTVLKYIPLSIVLRQGERIIFSNDTADKLFKEKDGQHLRGTNFLTLVHPDYLETAKKNFKEANRDKVIIGSAGKLINIGNETIDVETTIIPLRLNNKKTHLILVKDMYEANNSKAMKLELQLAKDNERLCNDFFANLYHEFRTPLNVIYTSCQLIDMYASHNSIDNIKSYNKLVKQNCFRISKLTNNIIDSTRISEGFYVISYSNIDFVKVVEDTALSVASYLEKNNIDIIFDTDVEEKFIMADEEKIERIVLNLLSNAVKYRCENHSRIEIKIEDKGEQIILSIKDNGIGISKEKQTAVFNRFIKVDLSLNRDGEGTGLGLYIVKSLVELHKGTIELKSEENKGSEFIIRLPVITSQEQVEESKIVRTMPLSERIQVEFSDIYGIYKE